ncbi:N-acetylglucosamine-6-phosphate deacetylase [Calothrix sp. UHCC 0171]|uniref:N-acetylglucosamine-6-phosphate deacetylase n=1 Tax=Calothrix sp. UHCC 0171 TaxID=3110245 RepID=UPI002B1F4A1F|nr:N-acetylglucosamine-6-phosphate deacetylase [Calothrix sp. UHCC 0171]MEA5572032.1 N-acetylglucosamine-6-phosphate deacetylase [Calothrix sp. UHCC 0171]
MAATENTVLTPVDIINARVPGYEDLQMLLLNQEGIVEEIVPMDKIFPRHSPNDIQVIDCAGDWVSLGGVDLQINGALGLAFPDFSDKDRNFLVEICEYLWNCGVDGFLPTIVTTAVGNIHRCLNLIADTADCINTKRSQGGKLAQILGLHLEGPFLNSQKRGAHPQQYLSPLTVDAVKRVLGSHPEFVKVITLAPELDTTGEVIPYLRGLGITVSLGHSQATAHQAQAAFAAGATMVTHAFNAMPPLHHRQPGLLAAAITNPQVMCGFIADGEHVTPIMLDILLRASNYQQGLFLVSDALAPLGLADGVYPWDSREILVKHGTARLADGTLSGTTLPLLVGVQNLIKWGICEVENAIALATIAPRRAIGLSSDIIGTGINSLLRWHLPAASQELTYQRFN